MFIGERIKKRRLELGLTQTELAHRMGLSSKSSICRAERTNFNPTTESVKAFADALGTTTSYLMGWEDDTPNLVLTAQFKELEDICKDLNAPQIERLIAYAQGIRDAGKEK